MSAFVVMVDNGENPVDAFTKAKQLFTAVIDRTLSSVGDLMQKIKLERDTAYPTDRGVDLEYCLTQLEQSPEKFSETGPALYIWNESDPGVYIFFGTAQSVREAG